MPKKQTKHTPEPRTTGSAQPQPTPSAHTAAASREDSLRRLYATMLRLRLVQEMARSLVGITRRYGVAVGHEAVTGGATTEIGEGDTVTGSPQSLAVLLAKGVPLQSLFKESLSDDERCRCKAEMPEDPFNLGTGIALAHKLAQQNHVVVAFCQQPQPALETWHDALKAAAVQKLPIVFVIENGIASESAENNQAPHLEAFSFLARDYGFPGMIVDGSDAVAVWRVAQEGIRHARSGSGPTLIDCRTDLRRDPLAHMEAYLRSRHLWDDEWKRQLDRKIRREMSDVSRKS